MTKIFKLKDVLYHGTVVSNRFRYINISKGRGFKDFGKGFYLAYSKKQSIGMALRSEGIRKLNKNNRSNTNAKGIIYTYHTNNSVLKDLKVKVFDTADLEWLEFILKCRSNKYTPHDYDIVVGPTADDSTAICINNYREGLYGNPDSIKSKSVLLSNLEVYNLGIQVFIGTEKGLSILNQTNRMEEYV